MVAPPRGLLPVVLALLVLATGPARAATECDLCTQAVDELRGGQVSGCGTPGTNPDFAVVRQPPHPTIPTSRGPLTSHGSARGAGWAVQCSRTVQTLLVNTHRVTSLLWEGCMVTDEQETPKKEVPCPSNDICAAVLPVRRGMVWGARFAARAAPTTPLPTPSPGRCRRDRARPPRTCTPSTPRRRGPRSQWRARSTPTTAPLPADGRRCWTRRLAWRRSTSLPLP